MIPAGIYIPLIRPLVLAMSPGKGRKILRRLEVFTPYFSLPVRYEDSRTRRRLSRAGISVRPVSEYFGQLMDYAIRAEWGKAEVPRFFAGIAHAGPVTEFTPLGFAGNDDEVMVFLQYAFTANETGTHVSMHLHHYWRFRDGKVAYFRGSEDTALIASALGREV